MKYQIVVEKMENDLYLAYCPVITSLRAIGADIDSVLCILQRDFMCYLHDPEAEMEIMMNTRLDGNKIGYISQESLKRNCL